MVDSSLSNSSPGLASPPGSNSPLSLSRTLSGSDGSSNSIPCLVVPPSLEFSSNPSVSNNHAILTVYNPYNFRLEFKILSTNPGAYRVSPSSGDLPPQSSVKIIVKVKSFTAAAFEANNQIPYGNLAPQNPLNFSHRHPQNSSGGGSPPSGQNSQPSGPRIGDKFQVEISDLKRTLTGRTVVEVNFSSQNSNFSSSSTARSPAETAKFSPAINSNSNQFANSHHDSPFSNLSFPIKCLPLLIGSSFIYFLAIGELKVGDPSASLWIAFFIGLVTMIIQMKFFEA